MTIRKTTDELRSELESIKTELRGLLPADGTDLEGRSADRFDELTDRADEIKAQITRDEKRLAAMADLVEAGSVERGTDPGPTWRTADPQNATRDAALREIERHHKASTLADGSAAHAERLARADKFTGRLIAASGTDAYARAFAKLVADPQRGHLLWTNEEAAAYRAVEDVAAERGLLESGSGSALVPFQLDPVINITNAGTLNPIREIARTVTITSNAYHGVNSAGVQAEWLGEAQEAADASPTLTQPEIKAHKGAAWVEFSIEMGEDGVNLLAELQRLLADARANQEAAAFISGLGDGSKQPKGLVTALAAAGGAVVVDGAGTEAIVAADPYALQDALGARWQPNARFGAALPILNKLRQMETTNGALKFPGLHNVPASLLGRAAVEISTMDGTINSGATESNYSLVYGDFSQYVIVDRIGTTIELVPHLMGASRRPTGQRGVWMHYRVGADVINADAFRVLRVNTTA